MSKFDFLDRFHKEEKLDIDRVAVDDFAEQVGGKVINTDAGRYLEVVSDYPADFLHGDRTVATASSPKSVTLSYFEINEPERQLDLHDIVFVDAETTGLSAASGTVAFLLGVGYLSGETFRVHQFFLPDYPDEPAMLTAIADLVSDYNCVCTFNGKCFDLPLLEARYIMHRDETPFADMLRVDLLHSSRRFWRGRFADTTLQTLEKELLGLFRYGDTPGFMIPQLYFDFLKSGEAEPLAGVLQHNKLDIVSLLFLLHVTQQYLDNADKYDFYSAAESLLISKYYCRRRDFATGCRAATAGFTSADLDETGIALGFHLGTLQKRLGRYEEALVTFKRLLQCRGENRLLALAGLAKLLEHQFRDYQAAQQATREALDYLDSPLAEIPYDRVLFHSETLAARNRRLLRKLQ